MPSTCERELKGDNRKIPAGEVVVVVVFAVEERIGFEWHIVGENERNGEYEISIHLNDDEAKGGERERAREWRREEKKKKF